MADACLSSSLDNFGPETYFFGMQALPKNRGTYVDDENWQTVQTGMHKPVWPVKVTLPEYKLDFTIA